MKNKEPNKEEKKKIRLFCVDSEKLKIIPCFPIMECRGGALTKHHTKFGVFYGDFGRFLLTPEDDSRIAYIFCDANCENSNGKLYGTMKEAVEKLGQLIDTSINLKTQNLSRRAGQLSQIKRDIEEIKVEILGLEARKRAVLDKISESNKKIDDSK